MKRYNCHTHIFNYKDTGDLVLPLFLGKIIKYNTVRKPLEPILKFLFPFSSKDLGNRFAKFIEYADMSQEQIFVKMKELYETPEMRFIILPMDMHNDGCGKVKRSWKDQHLKLVELYNEYPEIVIPFMAVNPQRDLDEIRSFYEVNNSSIFGIKLYPPLWADMETDTEVKEKVFRILDFALEKKLPIIAHCSKGGIKPKDVEDDKCYQFTSPFFWEDILDTEDSEGEYKYRDLNLCLAHFGGDKQLKQIIKKGKNNLTDILFKHDSELEKNWTKKLGEMLISSKYPNLYTDISYSIFSAKHFLEFLEKSLSNDMYGAVLSEKILFGSDFYMKTIEHVNNEKEAYLRLEEKLSKENFDRLTSTNPERFLFGE